MSTAGTWPQNRNSIDKLETLDCVATRRKKVKPKLVQIFFAYPISIIRIYLDKIIYMGLIIPEYNLYRETLLYNQ